MRGVIRLVAYLTVVAVMAAAAGLRLTVAILVGTVRLIERQLAARAQSKQFRTVARHPSARVMVNGAEPRSREGGHVHPSLPAPERTAVSIPSVPAPTRSPSTMTAAKVQVGEGDLLPPYDVTVRRRTLAMAVRQSWTVEMIYVNERGEWWKRMVQPVWLGGTASGEDRGKKWRHGGDENYFGAFGVIEGEPRSYRVDRVRSIEIEHADETMREKYRVA